MALAVGLAVMVAAPYLLAIPLAPEGTRFSGFLVNPQDGFSYLAKMRQGASGSWQFVLPYTAEPGEGAYLFLYHIALGHLARVLSLPLLYLYHAARIVGVILMARAAWSLLHRVLPGSGRAKRAAALALFGSGLGYLGLPFGLITPDLNVPEAIPFMAALANAHFPLALAAFSWLALSMIQPQDGLLRTWLWPVALGALLALLQPFAVGVLALVFGLAWLAGRRGHLAGIQEDADATRGNVEIRAWIAMLWGAGPILLYDLAIVRAHPVLRIWNAQNLTPSPPPHHFAIAMGLPLILALAALAKPGLRAQQMVRLLSLWALTQGLLLYAPFSLQRRLALGLFFPLVALGIYGFTAWTKEQARRARWLWLAVFLLSLPSNALVLTGTLFRVAAGDPLIVLSQAEEEAYRWMGQHLPTDALVLAGPRAGNRIPAFAALRVIYGHPFETIHSDQALERVQMLLAWEGEAQEGLAQLHQLGVGYVFYGPEESTMGKPSWLALLNPLFRREGVIVYEVPEP
jgi:hypothetical protein